MSTIITIYHQGNSTLFNDFDPDTATLKLAYSYLDDSWEEDDWIDPPMFLEGVFRDNNAGAGGHELNVQHCTRSLSVGDVVGLPDGFGYWTVCAMGWSEVTVDEVEQALNRNIVMS
jgi:hypothetical protein